MRWAALRALGSVGEAAAEVAEEAVRALVREGDAATRKTAEEALASMAPDSQARCTGIVEGLEQHYFKLVQAPPGSGYRTKGDRVRYPQRYTPSSAQQRKALLHTSRMLHALAVQRRLL